MADWDWGKIAVDVGTYVVSTGAGLLVGVWKWGRKSVQNERAVQDDYDAKIGLLRNEVFASMTAHFDKIENGSDLLVSQFKESFDGIRRQHDDHKLDVEKRFLLKDDFFDFRKEYREDMRELKANIAAIRS